MALRKKLGISDDGWGIGESGTPNWAFVEYDTIKREADHARAVFCPQRWGYTGPMQAFMKRYRDYLVKERIPCDKKCGSQKMASYAMFNAPTAPFRSLATHEAVQDYMKLAGRLYGEREAEPRCAVAKRRDISGISVSLP
jgi:hypothetical protein